MKDQFYTSYSIFPKLWWYIHPCLASQTFLNISKLFQISLTLPNIPNNLKYLSHYQIYLWMSLIYLSLSQIYLTLSNMSHSPYNILCSHTLLLVALNKSQRARHPIRHLYVGWWGVWRRKLVPWIGIGHQFQWGSLDS